MTTPPNLGETRTHLYESDAVVLLGLARRLRDLDSAVEAARQDHSETARAVANLRSTESIPERLSLELRRRVERLLRLERERSELAARLAEIPRDTTVPDRVVSPS